MKQMFKTAAVALALAVTTPALAAQGEEVMLDDAEAAAASGADEMQQAMAMLGAMFPAEPLTAEQEARLPQAQRIIARIIPEGSMGELMGGMFDQMLGPMMKLADAPATRTVSKGTGLPEYMIQIEPEKAAEAALLFDPAYAERSQREAAVLPGLMRDMMSAMEPTMIKAMSELYAIHFSEGELAGIETFFQTEIGAAYARKSFTLSSDPRIMAASMEALPVIMESMAKMEAKLAAAGEGLPAKRGFADLTPAEQARVAELTGYMVEEIAEEFAKATATVATDGEAEGEAVEME
jgi:hypothetical protein